MAALAVYVEIGRRRVFASVRDWPGWARAGKDEDLALAALAEYGPRYAPVARLAHARFPVAPRFDVLERLKGDATTDFGAPGAVADGDREAWDARTARRHADLVAAAWAVLDEVVAAAPATLRKGPRGGGRDRDAVVEHVRGAEASYARMLDIRMKDPNSHELRAAITSALRGTSDGSPARERCAGHVLDHAWEIEDKSNV